MRTFGEDTYLWVRIVQLQAFPGFSFSRLCSYAQLGAVGFVYCFVYQLFPENLVISMLAALYVVYSLPHRDMEGGSRPPCRRS